MNSSSSVNGHKAHPFSGKFPTLEEFDVDPSLITVPFDLNSTSTFARKPSSSFGSLSGKPHECLRFDDQTQHLIIHNCADKTSDQSYCFTLWNGPDRQLLMGCWKDIGQQCPHCDLSRVESGANVYFCCCAGNRCNAALSLDNIEQYITQKQQTIPANSYSTGVQSIAVPTNFTVPTLNISVFTPFNLLLLLLPIALFAVLSFVAFIFMKRRKRDRLDAHRLGDKKGANLDAIESQQPFLCGVQIKQVEKIFTSDISTVWKGILIGDNVAFGDEDENVANSALSQTLPEIVISNGCLDNGTFRSPILPKDCKTPDNGRYVAIKVLSLPKTWKNEREVYTISQIRHKNILKFITAEEHRSNGPLGGSEYWLVTEYHPRGSLCDHLEAHTLSYIQMLKICLDISQGLAHLHSYVDRANRSKPIVAHRDLKSRNILLKNDLSACIADFGMSMILQPNQPTATSLGQVGTRRYMAPEYLDGAIHFSVEALLRIDIYACAIIFWEILSRCTAHGQPAESYMAPFEKELGKNVDLATLRKFVTEEKKRPQFPVGCLRHPELAMFCRTIEDCWEQDAEARLSASCVEERLLTLIQSEKLANESLCNKLAPPSNDVLFEQIKC